MQSTLYTSLFLLAAKEPPAAESSYQTYIFVAYGLACALLFVFTLWTAVQVRSLGQQARYLQERLDRAAAASTTTSSSTPSSSGQPREPGVP